MNTATNNDRVSWTAVGVIIAVLALCVTIGGFGLTVISGIRSSEFSLSKKITDGDAVLTEKINVIQNQLGIVMSSQIRDLPQRIALLEQASDQKYKQSDADSRQMVESAEFKAIWKEIERLRAMEELGHAEIKAWLQRVRDDFAIRVKEAG